MRPGDEALAYCSISPALSIATMSTREVFTILDDLLPQHLPVSVATRQDWSSGAPHYLRGTPRLRFLLPEPDSPDTGVPDSDSPEAAEDALSVLIARILRTAPDQLARNRTLPALGVDSLMGTEISTAIRRRFDVEVPTMRILDGATITELAQTIRDHGKATPPHAQPH